MQATILNPFNPYYIVSIAHCNGWLRNTNAGKQNSALASIFKDEFYCVALILFGCQKVKHIVLTNEPQTYWNNAKRLISKHRRPWTSTQQKCVDFLHVCKSEQLGIRSAT